jgi:hypothetical protein
MTTKNPLKPIYKHMIILGLVVTAASLYFELVFVTLGVVAGLILAVINFWLIQRTVGGLLAGKRSTMAGLYAVKMAAILFVLFLLVGVAGLDPIGLVTGFSVLVVATTTSGHSALEAMAADSADAETTDG